MSGRQRLPSAGLQRSATWHLIIMSAATALSDSTVASVAK